MALVESGELQEFRNLNSVGSKESVNKWVNSKRKSRKMKESKNHRTFLIFTGSNIIFYLIDLDKPNIT